ncbi:hypothetical protein [Streptomyces sp. NPDC003832]
MYRNGKTGGEITLGSNGTFTATDLSTDAHTDPENLHGHWEFVDSSGSDFVYLDIDERGIGGVSGVQLYARGGGKGEFSRPDELWSLVLTKASAQCAQSGGWWHRTRRRPIRVATNALMNLQGCFKLRTASCEPEA